MSHANSLSPFRGKVTRYIIPVSHFRKCFLKPDTLKESVVTKSTSEYVQKKELKPQPISEVEGKPKPIAPPKIKIEKPALLTSVSSLSLSSIRLKKEAEIKLSSKNNTVNNAQENFSQETLTELWKAYTQEKNTLGENNIAALLEMSQPELQADHKILLKTSSSLSKVELNKELAHILDYLGKALNNYKIAFEIKVEAHKNEEYVYGTKEKYEFLKKINPEIEVLKNEFDLEL